MPLTPFHLGPAFILWYIFKKHINLAGLLFGSIIVDSKAAVCLIFLGCETHDPIFHSFFGALWLGIVVAVIVLLLCSHLKNITTSLKIDDNYSTAAIFSGALLGTFSHIVLDICTHSNIFAFWPIYSQPFSISFYWFVPLFAILTTIIAILWFVNKVSQK